MNPEASLPGLLRSLCLTQMVQDHQSLADQAARDGWTCASYLHTLCENELASRARRRTERLLKESRLPATKQLANFDLERLPARVRRQVPELLEGHFVERNENLLAFGLPGRGKTHLLCAVAAELIRRRGFRILFVSAALLVQQLLADKRDALLRRLDGYDAILLDDVG